MSNLGMQKKDYNFFSYAIDSKRSARKKGITLLFLFLLYLILIFVTYTLLEYAIISSQDQIGSIENYLSNEEVNAQRILAIEKKQHIEDLKHYSESLNLFQKHMQKIDVISTRYIGQVVSAIPQGLYFDNLSMNSEYLEIHGTAPNRQIIAEYLNNMQELNLFTDVHISNITTVFISNSTDSTYSFVMNCQMKDVIEE